MTRSQTMIAIGVVAAAGVGTAITARGRTSGPAAQIVASRAVPQADPHLTVVELFQSQGCSDCPPAEANVNAIAGDPHILALSYGVTYWDQLGWKDTFATPQFTERQWQYARKRARGSVWTPQVYVDGQADVVGSNRGQLDQTIARSSVKGPTVRIDAGQVMVGAGAAPSSGATVWLVRYDPRTLDVPIRAGENGGRTLPHRNIVRQLVPLGVWHGGVERYPIPTGRPGLATAALVQAGSGGPIVAAAKG